MPLLETVLLDVRYAFRVLRKSPAFTVVAVLTLMLGIGANVVVFGVLNAILLHPLEVSAPQSLYQIRHKEWMAGRLLTTSYPAFQDFQTRNTTFSAMAGINAYSHVKTELAKHGDEYLPAIWSPETILISWAFSRRQGVSSMPLTSAARIQYPISC